MEEPDVASVNDAGGTSAQDGDRSLLRVLLVDDTADFRALIRIVLERTEDFVIVGEAEDGRQGVEMARELRPDVVLLDIAMPVMDGLQALPEIRACCPGAGVVILSGFSASKMSVQAAALGADGYLQKGQPMRGLLNGLYRVVAELGLRNSSSASQ